MLEDMDILKGIGPAMLCEMRIYAKMLPTIPMTHVMDMDDRLWFAYYYPKHDKFVNQEMTDEGEEVYVLGEFKDLTYSEVDDYEYDYEYDLAYTVQVAKEAVEEHYKAIKHNYHIPFNEEDIIIVPIIDDKPTFFSGTPFSNFDPDDW